MYLNGSNGMYQRHLLWRRVSDGGAASNGGVSSPAIGSHLAYCGGVMAYQAANGVCAIHLSWRKASKRLLSSESESVAWRQQKA